MFLPQSLPLCPSGALVSSLKFSVSHQYATQHHIYVTSVWSAAYGQERRCCFILRLFSQAGQ